MTFPRIAAALVLGTALTGPALAAEPEQCQDVTFSDVGWSDITATTALASTVLQALGYETETKILSVPVTYTALSTDDVDVFLGNWMPTMQADIAPYTEAGTVDTVRTNLTGAKYTLATNKADAAKLATDAADTALMEELREFCECAWRAWKHADVAFAVIFGASKPSMSASAASSFAAFA